MPEAVVRDLLPRVETLCPRKSLPTYHIGFVRLVEAFGEREIRSVTPLDLVWLRDTVQHQVGEGAVAEARKRGRALRSYDPDAHGRGAAENLVRSMRFFFKVAVNDGLASASPAASVRPPRRPPPPERPLSPVELRDVLRVASVTGDDPALDRRLVLFIRHTACRREGCINLVRGALHSRMRKVTLSEKQGQTRDLPLAGWLLEDLDRFAATRGGWGLDDAVFRYADGHPLTRRRFNTLFDRLDKETDWAEPLDVGAHWLRHTTLSDIAAVSGIRVAEAYAGHSPDSAPTIFRYTFVDFDDLVRAYEAVFGAR